MQDKVSDHFLAAVGIEYQMDKAARSHLQVFYQNVLVEYRKEMQYERARLMRQNPMDYRAVRGLDRDLDDVVRRLQEMELEQSFLE